MNCKQSCPGGYEWRHVSTEDYGCCASFWDCFGSRKVCKREYPCDGPNGWRKRRLEAGVEQTEEIPIEEAEGDEVAYLLDDSEYDEEKLKQMTQEELDEFIGELASHPHKSYSDDMLEDHSGDSSDDDRRLEFKSIESRLEGVLKQTIEN